MKNLSALDVVAIGLSWVGTTAIAFFAKDFIVSLVCVGVAYYLVKVIATKNIE